MKKTLLIFSLLFTCTLFSQQQEDAWLFLKDKPNANAFIENPLRMLTQRAIDRRSSLQVAIDEVDVPVHQTYLDAIKSQATITVVGKSKWLNAVHIQGTKEAIDALFTELSFIKTVEFANKNFNTTVRKSSSKIIANHLHKFKDAQTVYDYGSTSSQIKMLKGEYLHAQGFTGEGQVIAIIDAGFPNVNTLAAFQKLRENNQILGGYDFVERSDNFYTGHNHGTNVLSTIGGYLENEFVGAAPDASFYLFRSENAPVEVPLEETLWVEAAERADSLGVDVINTSLGYSTFDNPNYSYSYEDMDGKTTFISRGAEIAASRGILVVNSAGNSGNDAWKYITAPADATSVITVGAVDANRNIASFSSFGPTADKRVKPEILAQGVAASIIKHTDGSISSASGTSFSAPIMAGLIACLNGNVVTNNSSYNTGVANSQNANKQLKEALYASADRFTTPTEQHGYGIPNFEVALNAYLAATASVTSEMFATLKVVPNPVLTIFTIEGFLDDGKGYRISIFDVLGKSVISKKEIISKNVDISFLKSGIYYAKISKENKFKTVQIIKL